jgi:malate dehydrogenase (oxaloacetate-decarboxylating)(NADP+)
VLGFPFLFRAALDMRARTINLEMKKAASQALAKLAQEPVTPDVQALYKNEKLQFGPKYILPKPFDLRVLTHVSLAAAEAAVASGVARVDNLQGYKQKLERTAKKLFALRSETLC